MTKKRRKNRPILVPIDDFESFTKKIDDYKLCLSESQFYEKLVAQLDSFSSTQPFESILCYGLGKFTSSVVARYQLTLLLLIKQYFNVDVYVFDPVFSEIELSFLNNLSLRIIEKNEEGARKIESRTLVFMPHCPTALINNLLWCNWKPDRLCDCVLIGNSFATLAENHIARNLSSKYTYLSRILPATTEMGIENSFKFSDVFNDLALHAFRREDLEKLASGIWTENARPVYEGSEIECVSNMLQSIRFD